MGLFDFVRDAGEKLGIVKDKEKEAVEEYIEEQQKANALWHMVTNLGLQVEDLQVLYDDGVATLHGKAPSQTEKEKVILAVGNTQGVGQVDDRIEVVEPAPEAVFYTVESGDTLSKISLQQYGDAMKYPMIFEANKPMLTDPDLIYPGQVLRIPALEA
jgi:nucleoid-associated protein YgaU